MCLPLSGELWKPCQHGAGVALLRGEVDRTRAELQAAVALYETPSSAAFPWLTGTGACRHGSGSAREPSCPSDEHHFVAFGVGDPPAILRLVEEPATGCDGRGEARLREVRRHSELEVDAVALPAPLRLRSVELLEHQHRVQPPRIVDVAGSGSPIVGVSQCGDPE